MQLQVLPRTKPETWTESHRSDEILSVPPALLEPEDAVNETAKWPKRQPEGTNARVDFTL